MTTVVLIAAAGAEWERQVDQALDAHPAIVVLKRCVDVDDLLATAASGQAAAAVVALDAPGLDRDAVDRLTRNGVRPVAIAAAALMHETARLRADRVGLADLVAEGDLDRLADLLTQPPAVDTHVVDLVPSVEQPAASDAAAPDRTGQVVAVWGPAGAPGRTTIAAALAVGLGARGGATLVDLDPAGGAVAQHLGVLDEVSGLLAAARLDAAGTLDHGLVSLLRRLAPGLDVLTGLPRPDRWAEVRPGTVTALVDLLRARGDVVLDLGASLEDDPAAELAGRPPRQQLTREGLEVADEIVVVATPDPVGLTRVARGLVELSELASGQPVRLVLNRMRGSLGWTERDVRAMAQGFVGVGRLHVLPEDRAAADRALSAGRSVAELGETALAKAIDAVCEELTGRVRPRRAGRGRRR